MVELENYQFVIPIVITESGKDQGMLKPVGDKLGGRLFTVPQNPSHIY